MNNDKQTSIDKTKMEAFAYEAFFFLASLPPD